MLSNLLGKFSTTTPKVVGDKLVFEKVLSKEISKDYLLHQKAVLEKQLADVETKLELFKEK